MNLSKKQTTFAVKILDEKDYCQSRKKKSRCVLFFLFDK